MGEILLVEVARVSRRERVVETQPQSDLRRGYRLYEDSRGARFRLGVGGLGEHRGWGGRGFRLMARDSRKVRAGRHTRDVQCRRDEVAPGLRFHEKASSPQTLVAVNGRDVYSAFRPFFFSSASISR